MEKGIAIIEVNEAEARTVFFDQDVIECARLNQLTKKHIEQMEAEKRQANRNRRKAEAAKAQRKAYTLDTVKAVTIECGIIGAVTAAGTAGMIDPAIYIPVSLFCLCAACLRLGTWIGKGVKA